MIIKYREINIFIFIYFVDYFKIFDCVQQSKDKPEDKHSGNEMLEMYTSQR